MIKLLLVDDHKIIRDGIRSLLQDDPSIQVVGEAANGVEVLEQLGTVSVDVVLMDVNMPEMDGYEATRQIKTSFPDVKVVVLSMLDNENYIAQLLDAGASGYVLKNAGRQELIHAIRLAMQGLPYICTDIALNLLKKLRNTQSPASETTQTTRKERAAGELSKREVEVLELIAQGYTNAEIAERLFTSKRTVETHRQNLLEKTSSNNTATLIRYAITHQLID